MIKYFEYMLRKKGIGILYWTLMPFMTYWKQIRSLEADLNCWKLCRQDLNGYAVHGHDL